MTTSQPHAQLLVNAILAPGPDGSGPPIRVLHVDHALGMVAVIELAALSAWPKWEPVADLHEELRERLLLSAVHVAKQQLGPLTNAALQIQDMRWQAIRDVVHDPEHRILYSEHSTRIISEAAKRAGVSRVSLRRFLRLYWQGGQTIDALVPKFDRCGARGRERPPGTRKRGRPSALGLADSEFAGINVSQDVKDRLQLGYRRFYAVQGQRSLKQAYRLTIEHYFANAAEQRDGQWCVVLSPAHELPTEAQFRYWGSKSLSSQETLRKRVGERRFNLQHRPLIGSAQKGVDGPGSLYQVDATLGDVYLLSSLRRGRIIGRPVIYVVIDVYSRMVAGFHVALEGPSWEGMRMALENAFCDKAEFCARYGHDISTTQWPCVGLPQGILGDRGELLSSHADHLVSALGVRVSNAAPYRADWKAIVERHFRVINDEAIKWVPGAVHGRRERGDRDCRLDATLTVHGLNELLIALFLHYNHANRLSDQVPEPSAGSEGVPPYPLDLWNWGIANRSGVLRVAEPGQVRRALLPSVIAVPTPRGLRVNGLTYSVTADVLRPPLRGTRRRGTPCDVAYDPRDVSSVLVRSLDGSAVSCPLHPHYSRFAGVTLEEVHDQRACERQSAQRHRSADLSASVDFSARVDLIVEKAAREAPACRPRTANGLDIRSARKAERTARRKEEAATALPNALTPRSTSLGLQRCCLSLP